MTQAHEHSLQCSVQRLLGWRGGGIPACPPIRSGHHRVLNRSQLDDLAGFVSLHQLLGLIHTSFDI